MAKSPSLLVFGSQTPWPSNDQLLSLRSILLSVPQLNPLLQAIESLDDLCNQLIEHNQDLKSTSCQTVAKAYQEWANGSPLERLSSTPPNSLSTPLTILLHIAQYCNFVIGEGATVNHEQVLKSTSDNGIQGFCTGLLSALAVSTSKSENDLGESAARCFRLAFAIGAYVDLEATTNETGGAACVVVKWRTEEAKKQLYNLVDVVPGAYVSVVADSSCVSITLPSKHLSEFQQQLSDLRLAARQIEIHGRFHSSLHENSAAQLRDFCSKNEQLQLPSAQNLNSPLRSNIDANLVTDGSLHGLAIESILLKQSNWYPTFLASLTTKESQSDINVAVAGLVDPVPATLARDSSLKIYKLADQKSLAAPAATKLSTKVLGRSFNDDAIAIVGMSCKFPGANSVGDFWNLIKAGTSVVDVVAEARFETKGLRRTADGKTPFWGCFVSDVDAFDHEFFKKSPREAASMDPKQRMLLEEAYHAMESTGQWAIGDTQGEDIGCFVGVATDDYYDNVNSHAPNAFSATGTLRAFLSGKISHYFGWTGPSITYDTACSGSLVAIHAACKSLLAGECSRAIAGGVNAISSPNMYQNLAAATFLSKTGICKPFDENADGYCRGEGVGLVVLKKLSAAVADGDDIISIIAASATNQNSNETAITVPHMGSQKTLYRRVLNRSGVKSSEVSYVEAHGTGTAVGDPREMSSIREVFGNPDRADVVHIGSVKGNIGHLEAASGVASLIKTILMLQHQEIPPAASFNKMNPKIPALEPDRMAITKTLKPWKPSTSLRFACINNYGASGNNAAMIVAQGSTAATKQLPSALTSYPIYISAQNDDSFQQYAAALAKWLQNSSSSLAEVAYELNRTQNRAMPFQTAFSVSSKEELATQLLKAQEPQRQPTAKPVVLAFGGQSSNKVGLDTGIYESAHIFRQHIDNCDRILRKAGLEGVIPAIFSQEPIPNIVTLHACFFAIQYAVAMAWIDSGLKVDAVVGHSFGQLTALSVSGHLSLEDGLKYVTGRAQLMSKLWGPIKGSMISVEATPEVAERLCAVVEQSGPDRGIEIACYNGPTSHTLVGTPQAIDFVPEVIAARPESFSGVRSKKLNVTNGFHSVFTEPLLPGIIELGKTLKFSASGRIHLETSSKESTWPQGTAERLAEHTRTPVYFGDAVNRLTDRLGPCTWIEAGTGSSVTAMVRRALGPPHSQLHSFETVAIDKPDAITSLAEITSKLRNCGHRVSFWPFHAVQKGCYSRLNLPPYQFKKSRHWLPYIDALKIVPMKAPVEDNTNNSPSGPIISFSKFLDDKQEVAEFRVNKYNAQFQLSVKGHAVLDQPLCPAGEYIELAVQAAILLERDIDTSQLVWGMDNLSMVAPLGMDPEVPLKLRTTRIPARHPEFQFELYSDVKPGVVAKPVIHGKGRVSLHEAGEVTKKFTRIGRLIDRRRYQEVIQDENTELLAGALVYKLFSKVVTYADFYKGLKKVGARQSEIASYVSLPPHSIPSLNDTIVNTLAVDNFLQVAGIHVNCLQHCDAGDVYVCTEVEQIQHGPAFSNSASKNWLAYSTFNRLSDREVNNDIFIIDEVSSQLCIVFHGVRFTRVRIDALGRTISRANSATNSAANSAASTPLNRSGASTPALRSRKPSFQKRQAPTAAALTAATVETIELTNAVKKLINQVADIRMEDIRDDASLEEIGVDSLMVHELHEEMKSTFDVDFPAHELGSMTFSNISSVINSRKGSVASSAINTPSVTTMSSASSVVNDDSGNNSVDEFVKVAPNDLAKLAKFVSEQLGTTSTMTRETCLGDHGLDSLMSLELGGEIEQAFGVEIEHGWLTAETTFGQLADKVMPSGGSGSAPIKSVRTAKPPRKGKIDSETVMWKECDDGTKLFADIFLPKAADVGSASWPVALMVHGGGHTMLSRKDLRNTQTQHMLDNGFLPVSVDYRLSPEAPIRQGSMVDVCDALKWIHEGMAGARLDVSGLKINGDRVVVIGWSTGGTVSMTLPFTAIQRGVKPPEAILAFYCPYDYEAPVWYEPNYPEDSYAASKNTYDLLEGVYDKPITEYNIPKEKMNVGGWMNLEDTRSRIVLHMNWKGQMPAVLLNGLPTKAKAKELGRKESDFYNYPKPSIADIQSISPASQIRLGNYRVPTFIIHGTKDDLIPWQQAQKTHQDLVARGVPSDIRIMKDRVHLFDLYRDKSGTNEDWQAIQDGYDFIFTHGRS